MHEAPSAGTRPPGRGIGPFSRRQLTLLLGAIVLSAGLITIATRPLGTVDGGPLPNPEATAFLIASPTTGLRPGSLAPELTTTRSDGSTFELADLDGHPIRMADMRGRTVWLNFWASWCGPCQRETPVLRDIASMYRDRGLLLIGVEVQETVDDGRRYARKYSLPYTIGADVSGEILHLYRVYALPTQFLIDADGRIRQVVGGPVSQGTADGLLAPILAAPASPVP